MDSLAISTSKLRIASASGSAADRRHGFHDLAKNEDIQYIVGDWMSEANMTARGGAKMNSSGDDAGHFEPSFLDSLEPSLPFLAEKKIKVAVNAGASDTEKLYHIVVEKVKASGLNLKVAWIGGDEAMDAVQSAIQSGEEFKSLTTGKKLSQWDFMPIYAQCYLGCWGIVEAFKHGADIVLCGRVADASPTIACAAYHYGWSRQDYQKLACAFIAGHFIECSTYVTGGNFSGFKSLESLVDLGFPIVEIDPDGHFIVTMQKDRDGAVTLETCKSQLLYEIQGPLYYNSDVVARLDNISLELVGKNKVKVSGITGLPPPPTTKVGLTALGGYQAEAHYFLCGLDIEEKAKLLERQVRHVLDESKYHCLKFLVHGRCPENPRNQAAATVDLRIFAQAKNLDDLDVPRFYRVLSDMIMQSYPGATYAMDRRQAIPKPYYEYWVALLPQSAIQHVCHLPSDGLHVPIPAPTDTRKFLYEQESYETKNPVDLSSFGETTRVPLGYVVHARSGDKGSDSNVGFFVRSSKEWDWLRSVMTTERVRELLDEEDKGKPIFRFELPNIWAVHFLLKDHLDRGVSASSSYDVLGKNVAEYLRCKLMDVPNKFLFKAKI